MKQISMVAREDFTHFDGTEIAAGALFDALPVHAAALHRSRKARFATEEDRDPLPPPAPAPPPETKALSAAKPKRPRKPRTRTNRRDIAKAPITK